MAKTYKNVKEMIRNMATEQRLKMSISKEMASTQLSKFLITLRCKNNLTQKQIAKKIGCTQSRISKIETSQDEDIRIKDLIDYAKALNLKLEIGYRHSSMKIVDLIKYHALKISEYLNQLVAITRDKEDAAIDKGVESFFGETIYNMIRLIAEPYLKFKKIKDKRKQEKEVIHISNPFDLHEKNFHEEETIKNLN